MTESDQGGGLDPRATALLVGGMACFGSATPISRIVGRAFPVWLASSLRMAIALLVLGAVLGVGRRRGLEAAEIPRWRDLDSGDRWLLAGIALVGTFGFTVLMLLGMREAPGAIGAITMATTPAVTAVGAVIFLHERLGKRTVAAIGCGLAGVVLVNVTVETAQGSGDRLLLGSALVFGAVCCEATYTLAGRRLTADLSSLVIATAAAAGALVAFVPFAVVDLVGFDWTAPTVGDWVAVVWWGLGTMALGSWLWFQGLQRVSGGTAAPVMAVMPVSALLLSYVLLDEAFQWAHLGGMALVLLGLLLVVRR